MNILAINPFQFNIKKHSAETPSARSFGLKMQEPLKQDTISFGATQKMLTNRKNGISLNTARKIHNTADELQKEIEDFMHKFFKMLIADEENPDNVIEYITGRTKKPESIVEKSATREWTNMAEVFTNMTDLNGVKIVLRDGSKKNVKQVLKRFEKAMDRGILICTEIENKCPIAAKKLKGKDAEKWNYATLETLDGFYNFAKQASGKDLKYEPRDYTDANYTAIHFLFRFPGQKRVFEVQLMGRNVAKFKDMDDIIFKILNNKNVDKEYQPLIDLLDPLKVEDDIDFLKLAHEQMKDLTLKLKDERNTDQRREALKQKQIKLKEDIDKAKRRIQISDLFKKYRSEAFLFQREKATSSYTKKEYFLPLKYDIPEEYDFNNIYQIYQKCEAKKHKNKK